MQQESTNILLGGLMGIVGGLITLPISTVLQWTLKRDEIDYKARREEISKRNELLLHHKLEMERLGLKSTGIHNLDLNEIICRIELIEQKLQELSQKVSHD